MALLKYFQLNTTRKQSLPDPNGELSLKILPSGNSSANTYVGKLLNSMPPSGDTHRSPYAILSPVQKFKIGKKAAEIGTNAAMRYYAKNYPDLELKETSVRRFKNNYQAQLKSSTKEVSENFIIQELVPKKRGCPLLIGEELDEQVREYIS